MTATYRYQGQTLANIVEQYDIDPAFSEDLRKHLDSAVDDSGMTVDEAVQDWLA